MSAMHVGRDGDQHLGELAELYALGALEPHERAQVEAHVASCANCARALGAAEVTVAALDDAFVPQLDPPERLGARIAASAQAVVPLAPRRVSRSAALPAPSFYATAAALLLAAGIGGGALVEHSTDVRQVAHDSAVLATIATAHFNHVSFTVREPSAPVSKVLYARDGAWFYVVIDSATCDCRVVVRSAAGERDWGKPEVRGSTATLSSATARVRPRSSSSTRRAGSSPAPRSPIRRSSTHARIVRRQPRRRHGSGARDGRTCTSKRSEERTSKGRIVKVELLLQEMLLSICSKGIGGRPGSPVV